MKKCLPSLLRFLLILYFKSPAYLMIEDVRVSIHIHDQKNINEEAQIQLR